MHECELQAEEAQVQETIGGEWMAKIQRVTIKKEHSHWVVSVGGRGMCLAFTKSEARMKQKQFQEQVHGKKRRKKHG